VTMKRSHTLYRNKAERIKNEALLNREAEFARQHKDDSDEALLQYIRDCAEKLGHIPKKHEVIGFTYLKSRFGPWPRVLEKAGLKELKKKSAYALDMASTSK
jgi:hypothetical protein